MSYKNELEGNNADLRAILDTVNELPENKPRPVITQDGTVLKIK